MVITGLKAADSVTAHACNMKGLVKLLVQDLVHEVLDSGIKIARVLLMVGLEGQLGLGKGRVGNSINEMMDESTRVIGSVISFLHQDQHRLVCLLVAFNICIKCESTSWPALLGFSLQP